LPKQVSISPQSVREISQGIEGGISTAEETDLIKTLGLTGQQWKNAIKNGIKIDVPIEKIVTITDKPYWAKVKGVLELKRQRHNSKNNSWRY